MTTEDSAPGARRSEILECGLEVLIEKGWRGTSMIAIARKANASKETLYNWFGDKAGFFAALIRHNAQNLDMALPDDFVAMSLEQGLRVFGHELLLLITSAGSIALNRAAIAEAGADASLGLALIEEGKRKSLPKLADWLALKLDVADPVEAAERFVVLVKGERQLEQLLGLVGPLDSAEVEARVEAAVDDFLRLYCG